jgi:hypothetical protein
VIRAAIITAVVLYIASQVYVVLGVHRHRLPRGLRRHFGDGT